MLKVEKYSWYSKIIKVEFKSYIYAKYITMQNRAPSGFSDVMWRDSKSKSKTEYNCGLMGPMYSISKNIHENQSIGLIIY